MRCCRAISESFVDPAALLDGIQRHDALGVVDPEKNTPVADAIFLQSFQIGGEMAQHVTESLRVLSQPGKFSGDVPGGWRIQALEVLIEGWGGGEAIRHRLLRGKNKRPRFSAQMFAARPAKLLDHAGIA